MHLRKSTRYIGSSATWGGRKVRLTCHDQVQTQKRNPLPIVRCDHARAVEEGSTVFKDELSCERSGGLSHLTALGSSSYPEPLRGFTDDELTNRDTDLAIISASLMLATDTETLSRVLSGISWTKSGKKPAINSNHESVVVEVMESRGM